MLSLIDALKTSAKQTGASLSGLVGTSRRRSGSKRRSQKRHAQPTASLEALEQRALMTAIAINDGNWNDAATWQDGVKPDAETQALISHGVTVELDGSDHVAESVVVHGKLVVPEDASDPTELADGRMKLYVNGDLVGDAAGSQLWDHSDMAGIGGITSQSRTHLRVRRTGKQSGNFFDGAIDKVATHNRMLTSSEVSTLFQSDHSTSDGVPQEDIASLWLFDDVGRDGRDVADGDAKADNGTLLGDASTDGALQLDGDGDYVKVGRSTDINRGVFTEKSISLWFKADTTTGTQMLYEQGGATRGLSIYLQGDTLYAGGWNIPSKQSGWRGSWISKPGIVAGEWNHVALTLGDDVDKSLSTRWVHVNGGGEFIVGSDGDRYDEGTFTLELTGTDKDHDPVVPMRMPNGMTMQEQLENNDGFLMTGGTGRIQFYGEDKLSFTKLRGTAKSDQTSIVVENTIERNFNLGNVDSQGRPIKSAADDGVLNWEVGDEIVIASTSYDYREEETRILTGVKNNGDGTTTLSFEDALLHDHYGETEKYRENDSLGRESLAIDMRAEVALLSRNVKVTGLETQDTDEHFGDRKRVMTEDRVRANGLGEFELFDKDGKSTAPAKQVANGVGGHIMIMPGSGDIVVDGVQLDRLGQASQKGRYPIHWHLGDDRSRDIFRNSSVTNSNNRGVTIHGTNKLTIEGVVVHDVHGHGFFFEDAVETENTLLGNLVIGVHSVGGNDADFHKPGGNDPFVVDTHDTFQENRSRFSGSAAYWITNPKNTFVGNIAAGAGDQRPDRRVDPETGEVVLPWVSKDKAREAGTGFWYAIPRTALGESSDNDEFADYHPIFETFGQFDYNTSHTTAIGLNFDRGSDIEDAHFGIEGEDGSRTKLDPSGIHLANGYKPTVLSDPSDPDSPRLVTRHYVDTFTNYKASEAAVYHRGEANTIRYRNLKIADSYNGPWAVSETRFDNSLYVGHSRGNSADRTIGVGGPRLYDGAGRHEGAHFAGFTADTASTFQVEGSSFGPTMYHVFPRVTFETDGTQQNMAHAVSDFQREPGEEGHRLGAPQEWIKAAIDIDGSLTGAVGGGVGYSIVPKIDFLVDDDDKAITPVGWDAYLTDDIYARVRIENLDDGSDVGLFPNKSEDPFIVFTAQDDDKLFVTSAQNLGNGSWTQVAAKADDEGVVEDDFTVEFGMEGLPEGGFVLNMNNQDGGWLGQNRDLQRRVNAARLVIRIPSASNYHPEGVDEVSNIGLLRFERGKNVFFRDTDTGDLYLNTDITASQGKIRFSKTGDELQSPAETRTIAFGTVIEAEDFDSGTKSVAFNDTDGTVDVSDGKVIDIESGEWLEYTADITDGPYDIGVNFSSTDAEGEIVVLAAKSNSAGYHREIGRIAVGDTNGQPASEWLEFVDLAFAAGEDSVFRLEFEGTGFEVDSFEFREPQNQFTYNGIQRTISATDGVTIKLPEYDEGGEGVAYSDTTPDRNTASSGYRPGEGVDSTPDMITNSVEANEWLEYTTDVQEGIYSASLNKNWGDGKVRLLIGRRNSATTFRDLGTFSFGQQGEADVLTLENIDLTGWGGEDLVIRVEILEGFMGLHDIKFSPMN